MSRVFLREEIPCADVSGGNFRHHPLLKPAAAGDIAGAVPAMTAPCSGAYRVDGTAKRRF